MSQEYQHLESDSQNQNIQDSIYRELESIYASRADGDRLSQSDEIDSGFSFEYMCQIADDLSEARTDYLERQNTQNTRKNLFITEIIKKVSLVKPAVLPKSTPVLTENILKRKESEIGASLFGELKTGERREFFNEDRANWFFYQEINSKRNQIQSVTLHYEVRPDGVLLTSSRPETPNKYISGNELDNFTLATQNYYEQVMLEVYNRPVKNNKNVA